MRIPTPQPHPGAMRDRSVVGVETGAVLIELVFADTTTS
jgi:hypothetical protein